ncbi:MAG TPA: GMC family oxidoreductase N-terminal domain-containing protein [Polyangiaceae bacterium]|jgi:choline dehydrogenase-like flavoprotein
MASYDYVILGAGSAGCVLASRLGEDPSVRVLVVEAGGSDASPLFRKPGMLAIVYQVPRLKKRADWGYRTTPQEHLDGRRMPWTRGKILGGCSTVNGMLYVRGNRKNYDDWAASGCAGWSYADVLPYFKKSECHEDGESEFHGGSGPLQVTRQEGISPVSEAFVHAIAETCGVPRIEDFNGPSQEGASTFQMTCRDRMRSSAAVAFLHPASKRPNVTVVSGATVVGLVVERGRVRGARYVQGGAVHEARVEREVILSAGVIGSPQILMLSGIGPADDLRALGITPVCDVPGVGRNLQDHLMCPLRYRATKDTGHRSTPGHFFKGMLDEYLFGKGWFGKTFLEGGAFVKSDASRPIPDLQFHSIPWAYPEPNDDGPDDPAISKEHSFTILPGLIYPRSRGTVRLRSADPLESPDIDPRYLSDDADMKTLVRAFEMARDIAASRALAPFLRGEATPGTKARTEAEIRAAIRLYAKTIYHPVGTCKMGLGADAVVDPELRVRGIEGLRVADASIMPTIVGGNTNAPSIMIGERAADVVRATTGVRAAAGRTSPSPSVSVA